MIDSINWIEASEGVTPAETELWTYSCAEPNLRFASDIDFTNWIEAITECRHSP